MRAGGAGLGGSGHSPRAEEKIKERYGRGGRGALSVIGIGPGSLRDMTVRAREAIEKSDTVVGYSTYIQLAKPLLDNKEVISTGMTTEVQRCREAIRLASDGRVVALISSGDPGIYGMAGLVLELLNEGSDKNPLPSDPSEWVPRLSHTAGGEGNKKEAALRRGEKEGETRLSFDLEIIPGVPAVCSAAASLGAPLMHDFAVISLSDLLTPWELIEKRLGLAAEGDFVISLYNPRSKGRPENLAKALDIVRRHRNGGTPVGVVKDSAREGERITVTTLKDIPVEEVDMTTIIIIGNSKSFSFLDYIVTPRGYKGKRI